MPTTAAGKRAKLTTDQIVDIWEALQFEEEIKEKYPLYQVIRKKIWNLVGRPESSRAALAVACFIILTIVVSTANFLLETMPRWQDDPPGTFFIIECICIAIFTVEFVLRLLCCPSHKKFVLDPMNTIDLLAIAPFYVELAFGIRGSGFAVLRVLRLARVFRIFKVGRYTSNFMVVLQTLYRSIDGFFLLFFFLSLGMILFSSLLWYAEQTEEIFDEEIQLWIYEESGEVSPFQSIPHTLWWSIVTITTVGYGDNFPITPTGKAVAGLTFLAGILIIAFPITILGTKFGEAYQENLLIQRYATYLHDNKHLTMEERAAILMERVRLLGEAVQTFEELMIVVKDRYALILQASEEAISEANVTLVGEEERKREDAEWAQDTRRMTESANFENL